MSIGSSTTGRERVVVLSGGGLLGACWQAGLADGFAEVGVALADAERLIGTSAGAIAGSQIMRHAGLRDLATWIEQAGGAGQPHASPQAFQQMFEAMAQAFTGDDPREGRRRLGRLAREARTVPVEDYLAFFAYLGDGSWPAGFHATSVDTDSGHLQVWGPDSGVDLRLAVASSGAAPLVFPPVALGRGSFMDGGVGSNVNAGLAAGADRAVIVSCLPIDGVDTGAPTMEGLMAHRSRTEIAALRRAGTQVEVVEPGPDLLATVMTDTGLNLMDPARAQQAFEAGRRESSTVLNRVHALWNYAA